MKGGALPRATDDLDRTAKHASAFLHAHETEATGLLAYRRDIESVPIVPNEDVERAERV
jgi:hypothetical protein